MQTIFADNARSLNYPNDQVVAFAPPHGKPTFVGQSTFQGYNALPNQMIADATGNLFVILGLGLSSCNGACVIEFAPSYTKNPVATISNESYIPYGNSTRALALDSVLKALSPSPSVVG